MNLFIRELKYRFEIVKEMYGLETDYDYNSIMNVKDNSFAIDYSIPTITALKGVLNRGYKLSQTDIRRVRKLYNCTDGNFCI